MRKAIVTGCSSGIGEATTKQLLRENVYVYGVDKVPSNIEHQNFKFIMADLSQFEINNHWPADIDIIINSAAIAIYKELINTSEEEIEKMLSINLKAAIKIINHYTQNLKKNKGNVVNIASVHSISSTRGNAIYAASKYALVGLTKNLAIELGPEIRVNAISPGAINTPMLRAGANDEKLKKIQGRTPMKRIGKPIDIANAITFIISDEASFITGVNLIIDGGASLQLHTG